MLQINIGIDYISICLLKFLTYRTLNSDQNIRIKY